MLSSPPEIVVPAQQAIIKNISRGKVQGKPLKGVALEALLNVREGVLDVQPGLKVYCAFASRHRLIYSQGFYLYSCVDKKLLGSAANRNLNEEGRLALANKIYRGRSGG